MCSPILKAKFLAFSVLVMLCHASFSQGTVENYMPFDPSNTESNIPLGFESYYFSGGHRFYSLNLCYQYGLSNRRNMMGITVPVVHNIFNDDYAGFENTTGIGDLRFIYMGIPYVAQKKAIGFKRLAAYLEVTIPTGNERLGRGVGAWVYRPGIIATYQPDIYWYVFPAVKFQFSTVAVNSQGGTGGIPDLNDPQADEKLTNIAVTLPTTYVLRDWDGWIGLGADYTYTFVEDTYFLFLRIEAGKMIGEKTSASLQLIQFVAGQPRISTMFKVNANFFLR